MRYSASLIGGVFATSALLLVPNSGTAQTGIVVQRHTTMNVAKITSSDLTQTLSILGADRAKTVTAGKIKILIISKDAAGTDITRLDKDSVFQVNDKKKEYTGKSLADLRADLAKLQKDAEKNSESKQNNDTRYTVVVDDAKNTGEKQTINGFSTEHAVIKLSVWSENTKTNVKTLAYHLTADSWLDKSQAEAGRAMLAFEVAQQQALGIDPAMASNPYATFMVNANVEMAKMAGFPIRTTMTLEMPADSTASTQKKADGPPPTSMGGMLGGLMGGGKKKDPEPASPNGGVVVFTSMTEVTSISLKAPAASEFDIPAGYVKK